MNICQWVDENGEKCEYVYLPSKDGNMYKVLLPSRDFHDTFSAIRNENEHRLSLSNIISVLQFHLNSFTDMIPLKMIGNISLDFEKKHQGKWFNTHIAFKCTRSWMTTIYNYIDMIWKDEESSVLLEQSIIQEIEKFNEYFKKRCKFWRGKLPGETRYNDSFPWVTQEDIEQGNEILRKVIAYLETINSKRKNNALFIHH